MPFVVQGYHTTKISSFLKDMLVQSPDPGVDIGQNPCFGDTALRFDRKYVDSTVYIYIYIDGGVPCMQPYNATQYRHRRQTSCIQSIPKIIHIKSPTHPQYLNIPLSSAVARRLVAYISNGSGPTRKPAPKFSRTREKKRPKALTIPTTPPNISSCGF